MPEPEQNRKYDLEPCELWSYGRHHYATYWFFDPTRRKRWQHDREFVYYTPLRNCQRCGKLGTHARIPWRYDMYSAKVYCMGLPPAEDCELCLSCWNVVGPLYRRIIECSEIDKLIAKIKRAITHVRKTARDKDHGTA